MASASARSIALSGSLRRDDAEAVSVVYCELQAPLGPRASTTGKMLSAHANFLLTVAALLAFDLNIDAPKASTAMVQVGGSLERVTRSSGQAW